MTVLRSMLDARSGQFTDNRTAMLAKLAELGTEHAKAVAGGGEQYRKRHRQRGKLLARERIELLLDPDSPFLELSPLAGWGSEFAVGASVVTGIGVVSGVECLIVANDPTVKGGASNPWSLRKVFRANDIALANRLPVISLVIGGFASLTLLTKNSFLEEINKQYVVTARAKGLNERRVLYGHVFRNAMLLVIAGFPAAFIGILFTGALLIEVIFSLDGLGLLGFEAALGRDYPIMFGTLYIYTLVGLLLNLLSDLTYVAIDPRIDFERRDT